MALFRIVILMLSLTLVASGSPLSKLAGRNTPYPDLLDAELEDLIDGLECADWTSVQLTKAYIARIKSTNPTFHAVIEINPDALTIAAALDAERATGNCRGPLHGVPMFIKDSIATKDKLNTTAGSYALLGATVPRDSTVVTKLRAAGVVILGKSSLSEWANVRSSLNPFIVGSSSAGWSARGGQVTGAYSPNMDPFGSSSGSAVGTSLGLTWASLGTETYGSLVLPASRNNLVAIKPTLGLTSRSLVIPVSEHMDSVGPIARTVRDAAYVLAAIVGKDSNDQYTSTIPFTTTPDYVKACKHSSLRGARIGVPRNAIPTGADPVVMAAFQAAISVMKKAGAIIVENTNFSMYSSFAMDTENPFGSFNTVFGVDYYTDIPKYLSQLTTNPQNIHNVQDMINFTQASPLEQYPQRDTATWDGATQFGTYFVNNSSPGFWQAYQALLGFAGPGGVTAALSAHNLDALVLPTDYSYGLSDIGGFPIVNVPMGSYPISTPITKTPTWNLTAIAPNIPFGISLMGAKWTEESLIGYAFAYEQRTHFRRKIAPYTSPTTGLGDV